MLTFLCFSHRNDLTLFLTLKWYYGDIDFEAQQQDETISMEITTNNNKFKQEKKFEDLKVNGTLILN